MQTVSLAAGRRLAFAVLSLCASTLAGCGGDDDDGDSAADTSADDGGGTPLTADEVQPVVDNYAQLVAADYADTVAGAQALKTAVDAFVADPTEATMQAAKEAWFAAREPYGQSESFRFYGGPIDDDDGPEGRINAWPLDEAYVDYVDEDPDAGIINDPSIEITADMLASLNELDGEENIATGYHAIEFLLWGQDFDDDGPGARSPEDFVDDGPVPNADRRRLYLQTVAQMLVDDLSSVAAEWDAANGAYRASFVALPPDEAVQNMMRGIGALAAGELAEERINVAYDTKLQEDEHSCFSDNTHNDILFNFLAIQNVYFGDYGSVNGPGIDTLVASRDADLASSLAAKFAETEMLIRAIPAPFDQAIKGQDSDPGRTAVAAAVASLRELGDLLVEAAAALDITLNVALE